MQCPKCRMEQEDGNLLCDYCGTVFAKYRPGAGAPADGPSGVSAGARVAAAAAAAQAEASFTVYEPRARRVAAWLRERLLAVPPVTNALALGARVALLLGLAAWGWRLASFTIECNGAGESFMHLVNLPFHEAGHVFFTPFGDFVRTLGGTLGQLIMPMVCCLTLLLKTRDPFGSGAALWWFGENFLDIAPYIDDAGTGELPLLGGNTGESTPYGFHDWEYLMTETGRLGHEHDLARASHAFGAAVMAFALAWMALTLWRSYRAGRAAQPRSMGDLPKAA
jgi:hypothetical protein